MDRPAPYQDRTHAGRALAEVLRKYAGEGPVIVGLPRGGVVVAAEIARAIGAELDVILAGKLRAPYNPELAIGAVSEDGHVYLNRLAIRGLRIKDSYIEEETRSRLRTMRERLNLYRSVKEKVPLKGRTVIIVDDGLATGSTMISAIQAAHASGAKKIIAAVPGGPADTVDRIREMKEVSEVLCPHIPDLFFAVSQLYIDFSQVEDSEVAEILRASSEEERKRA
ncbi:MAG: phosphoribosyltransferase [Deltaproteobacteria bacterium]|nr:phosphoribosyltransferase [Deltaproteobacteria bacterium]MBZ0220064.1 phosphoribosyltransferase [Deltaproteobacteria bacterium]